MSRDMASILKQAKAYTEETISMNGIIRQLDMFLLQARNHDRIQHILQSLHFEQIQERQSEIRPAYARTFEWTLADDSVVNLAAWLRTGGGIYWVSGKAGCGKSTLMKFLLRHDKTQELLREWACPKRLLVLAHFFWAPGTPLQKSQAGLLRTLLFQLLAECPELIPSVCPSRWGSDKFTYLQSWTSEELLGSLRALATLETLPVRICLFVDGLDEYQGDHQDLVQLLQGLVEVADIKACVSSRPWKDFRSAFDCLPGQLRVHDFTAEDIRLYVEEGLHEDPAFQHLQRRDVGGATSLMAMIVSRAEGVFLWVYLVVRSLRRGLRYGDTLEVLRQRVEDLPGDLGAYFKRIMSSIEPVYAEEMRRNFQLLIMAETSLPLTIFDEELIKLCDQRHEPEPPLSQSQVKAVSEMDLHHRGRRAIRLPRIRDRLEASCRDLVHIWGVVEPCSWNIRVGFLHRTVVDFLQTDEVKEFVANNTNPSFKSLRTMLCRALLAQLQLVRLSSSLVEPTCKCRLGLEKSFALSVLQLQRNGYPYGDYDIQILDLLNDEVGKLGGSFFGLFDVPLHNTLIDVAPRVGLGWWPLAKVEGPHSFRHYRWFSAALLPQYDLGMIGSNSPRRSIPTDLNLAKLFLSKVHPRILSIGGCSCIVWMDFLSQLVREKLGPTDEGVQATMVENELVGESIYETCKLLVLTHHGKMCYLQLSQSELHKVKMLGFNFHEESHYPYQAGNDSRPTDKTDAEVVYRLGALDVFRFLFGDEKADVLMRSCDEFRQDLEDRKDKDKQQSWFEGVGSIIRWLF